MIEVGGLVRLEPMEVARKLVEACSNKQGTDIVLLDVREISSFADYFVICTGESSRQLEAIFDEAMHILKQEGLKPLHYEGTAESGWLLIDLGDIVVHIFAPFEREYYQLDKFWSNAKPVLRIQ